MEEVFAHEDEFLLRLAIFVVLGDEIESIALYRCLVKNPVSRGCCFEIFSMTETSQFRAGSGFWIIIGCLVVLGGRS